MSQIGYYKNINTDEIYEYFLKDIKSEPTKTIKAKTIRDVPHLRLITDNGKPKTPFKATEDFNSFNTFIKIEKP